MDTRAEVGLGFSPDFTVDTLFSGSRGAAVSALFTVDTRYQFNTGVNVSGLFRVDTRYSGSAGSGDSGLFTVDTVNAAQPSVAVSGRVTGGGPGLAGGTVSALFFNRVQASALTDGNGYYSLPLLPAGTYEFRAVRSSYVPGIWRSVVLGSGSSATVNFALTPQAAPATTTPVNQAPPTLVQLPTTTAQLKVWNGSDFVTGLSLQPNRPTVVITHGWQSSLNVWPKNMAERINTAVTALGNQVNLAGWDWENAANTLPDGRATSRTPDEGRALAQALISSLPGNDQPVHFIGHSLGSLVNARAADHLHRNASGNFPPERTHVTILDNGVLANGFRPVIPVTLTLAQQNDAALNATVDMFMDGLVISPFPDQARWIDNYMSLVGLPNRRAVNVYLTQGARFGEGRFGWGFAWEIPTSLHGYAHEWYRGTVSQPFSSALGHRHSYERQGAGADFVYAAGSRFEQNSTTDQFSLRQLGPYELSVGQARIAADTFGTVASGFVTIVGNNARVAGNVASSVAVKTFGVLDEVIQAGALVVDSVPRISLTTGPINALPQADGGGPKSGGLSNAPAYVWFDVAIPTNATHLTFDYELAGDPKEDCLAFAINGTNQFVLTAQFLTPGVMQTTSLLDVSGWAGQTVEFFFGVMGGTSTNATLAVDGLRFYSPQPPKLLAQKLSGQQLVLNWPLSASDYQLERSTSVGTSNGWAVVTNLPAVENFQFALTNSVGSSNTFFRLHRP